MFLRRLKNEDGPFTDDPVLALNRFTNVFRASDRVSQFLIRLQYKEEDPSEIFFKTLLFKIFNKIETYCYLENEMEGISYKDFSFDKYNDLLSKRMLEEKKAIYSAAYIMPSAGNFFGHKMKHTNHLALIEGAMSDGLHLRIQDAKSLEEVYTLLLSLPSIGSFLAFQYAIDLNYSSIIGFSEMDFVVAGPGAKNGISKCFNSIGDYSYEDVIRLMADEQESECERIGVTLPILGGRSLQLIDCQNIFCEVDKYLRATHPELSGLTGRTRIKQKYRPINTPIDFFFPPKWNITSKINMLCPIRLKEGIYL